MNFINLRVLYLSVFLLTTTNTIGVVLILKYFELNHILILETLFIIQCLSMIDCGLLTSSLRNYNHFISNKSIKEHKSENEIREIDIERLDFFSVNLICCSILIIIFFTFILLELFDLQSKYSTELLYLINLSVIIFLVKQFIVNRSISFGEVKKVKIAEMTLLFMKFVIMLIFIFIQHVNFKLHHYLLIHIVVDSIVIFYFIYIYKFSYIKFNKINYCYHIYHLHYSGIKNSITSLSGFFINFIVSMFILSIPNSIEKEMYLLLARLNNLTRYISQVTIISSLPDFYNDIGKYGYNYIYSDFKKKNIVSILIYILLSFLLLFIFEYIYKDFYFSLLFLIVFFIIEINQSNHAQIVLSKNTSPFLFVSIITSTLIYVLLIVIKNLSILDMILIQIICVLIINSWYSIYILNKEMKNEVYK